MATAAEVVRLRDALSRLSGMAKSDLDALSRRAAELEPEAAAALLAETFPALAREYGNLSAAVGAEWYDELRAAAGAPGEYRAHQADTYPDAATEARARSASTHLFKDAAAATMAALSTSLDKYVKQPARDTIINNAGRDTQWGRDKRGVTFARVPSGADPCDFCIMLGSRGAVYHTAKTAGELGQFHGNCNCQIVPIGPGDPLPEGYDPAELLIQWTTGSKPVDTADTQDDGTDPLLKLTESELEDRAEQAMMRGDYIEAERISEILDSNFYDTSGRRVDTDNPFHPDVYDWYESLDPRDQARFDDKLPDTRREHFAMAQWEHVSGRTAKQQAPARRQQREDYEQHLETEFVHAENATNGFMLTAEARAAGRTPRDLWSVNESTARSWASEEMLAYWDANPRYTWQDWQQMHDGNLEAMQKRAGTWNQ